MLDTVMQEAEGKRGNQEPKPKTSLTLVRSLLQKILPLVGTCTHQA